MDDLPPSTSALPRQACCHAQRCFCQAFIPGAPSWKPLMGRRAEPHPRACLPSLGAVWPAVTASFPHCSPHRILTFETGFLRDEAALGGERGRQEVSLASVMTGVSVRLAAPLNSVLGTKSWVPCQAGKVSRSHFLTSLFQGLVSFPMTQEFVDMVKYKPAVCWGCGY